MEYIDNGMDLKTSSYYDLFEDDEELKAINDRMGYVEEEWRNRITDYVLHRYPTQVVMSAETNSPKGLKERELMMEDCVLKDLQERSKEAYNKEAKKYTETFLRKEEEWLDKAMPCVIARAITRLKADGAAIEAARDHNNEELYRLTWNELKGLIGLNILLARELRHNKEELITIVSSNVSRYAFDTL